MIDFFRKYDIEGMLLLRYGDLKLMVTEDGGGQAVGLYDLKNDPLELKNIVDGKQTKMMMKRWEAWMKAHELEKFAALRSK